MFPIYQSLYRSHNHPGLLVEGMEQLAKMSAASAVTAAAAAAASEENKSAAVVTSTSAMASEKFVKSERGGSLSPPESATSNNPNSERKPFLKFSVSAILAKKEEVVEEDVEEVKEIRLKEEFKREEDKDDSENQKGSASDKLFDLNPFLAFNKGKK